MAPEPWLDDVGLVTLPTGLRVRGRRLRDVRGPADFALLLADGPVPQWPSRRIRWPDFWVPTDRADALDALHEAHRRAQAGERVEVACHGGGAGGGPLPRRGRSNRNRFGRVGHPGRPSRRAGRQLGAGQLPPPGGGDPLAAPLAARRPLIRTKVNQSGGSIGSGSTDGSVSPGTSAIRSARDFPDSS